MSHIAKIFSSALVALWLVTPFAFAQSGALPEVITNGQAVTPIMVSLPLEQASAIVDSALSIGREESMLPLTAVVLDSGGHMVAVKREDGFGIFRIEVVNAKV